MTDTDDRRALLAERLRQRVAERSYPLSYPQRRLWFLDQLDPRNPVYNVPLGYRIRGPLDPAALQWALTEVVRRHEVLRAVFREVDGEPRQSLLPAAEVAVGIREAADEAEARRLADEAARLPFDLVTGPVLRPTLIRLGPEDHWLCLTIHHIVCDGWSLNILGRELSALYRSYPDGCDAGLADLPIQYPDFAEWQVAHLTGETLDDLVGRWRNRLAGVPALASLPADHPRPPTQTYRGAHLTFDLPLELTPRVSELARQSGATPYAVLLAVFAVLVQAHTGEREVIVGSPVAGRSRTELEPLVGFFANTLVQRLDLAGNPTFTELVARARDESRAAVAHQDLPFEKLVEELHPNRDLAHNPLFQVLFSYHEDEGNSLALPGCEVELVPGDSGTAKFDLTMSITRHGERLSARLEYSLDLFDECTARRIAERFRTVVEAAVAQPSATIAALPVLTDDERREVLVDWSGVAAGGVAAGGVPAGSVPAVGVPADARPDALVHELIAAQVARTPDTVAVVGADGSRELTYRELDERAELLADRLRGLGVGPDVTVGVYLDRSPELVVTLLGILKAGGAYLPLDPTYPADRLSFMVADSGTSVVVSAGSLARRAARLPVTVLRLEHSDTDAVNTDAVRGPGKQRTPVTADNLAYVIYTSGSSGRPKGVMLTHANVATFFAGLDHGPVGADAPGTWLAVTSISFDISVLELLWTLTRGYRVVVRGDEPSADGAGPVSSAVQARPIDVSLFYFGGDEGGSADDRYRLLLQGARFADRNGFAAVWTPERHFHHFGGLYPNPSVLGAAVAAITDRVAIRAGSVVLPLHDPLRVAEEWSVVDNLSGGRVGISVASGWQPNDFVLAPDSYPDRKTVMLRGVEEVRRLWRGESVRRSSGAGTEVDVRIFPPPVQPALPVWVTSARSPETFQAAGEIGAGLLTHLLGHSVEQLTEKIDRYRQAWRQAGHPGDGHVALMLHTFVGEDTEAVRELVREPLCRYIKSSFDLLSGLGAAVGRTGDFRNLPADELDALVHQAFDRFFDTAALLGSPDKCADMIDRLKAIGVDEVACLIDFGVGHDDVLGALEQLAVARDISEQRRRAALADEPVSAQLRRHRVTHLQCTPSLAGVLAGDPDTREALGGLHRLLVGGEALPAPLAADLAGLVPTAHNMYGPTEATVWATTHQVGDDDVTAPIGRPMAGYLAYVVDTYLRPAPVNVPGELLLGGSAVARGYLDRPGLTAGRFIPDSLSGRPGARLYRTGDLVRWRHDGTLEFLGRLDHQVKIAGHRIELGEIENTVAAHPDVRASAVTVRGEGARREIVAYCVPTSYGLPPYGDAAELTAFARRSLPDYMVPSTFVFLDEFPLTPNGKVDRKRLPEPTARPAVEYRAPDSELEQTIAAVWAELLGRDRVGADDNFFALGGNSLLAVQARARLRARAVDGVSLVDLFRYPTVRTLAAAVCGDDGRVHAAALDAVRQATGRRVSAVAAQARLRRERRGQ
jgi:natural product biosynthesis luciferase-like monooxygenase protein